MFHPSPTHIIHLWSVFIVNIDPLVRLLHKPTTKERIIAIADNVASISDKPFEALLFAIYFASITSLTVEECRNTFYEEKETLLDRYRFAIQQALARATFLNSRTVVTLQALIIYLVWELSRTLIRVLMILTGI